MANLTEPRSVEEVAAVVLALDEEAERRYSALSRELRRLGSPAVAALLEKLGGEHRDHARQIAPKGTSGGHRDVALKDLAPILPRVLSEDAAADCDRLGLTPYRAIALAVTLAQQLFQLYSYLAAATDDDVHEYAQRLASEQLSRAARLRVERRLAYHVERRQSKTGGYPTAPLVESLADLLAAALFIETRLAGRLAKAGAEEPRLSLASQATRQTIERLHDASEQAGEPGGPMAEELARFPHPARTGGQAEPDSVTATRQLLADCERAFSFYDAVASAALEESVMLQAQDLSQTAVERIRQVRESVGAPDLGGRLGGNR